MGLVYHKRHAVLPGEPAKCFVVAGQRRHHPYVGEQRLGEHAGDIGMAESLL